MDDEETRAIAENLSKLMAHKGHTQERLAKLAGVSQRTISNMLRPESGHTRTLNSLKSVASVYGLKAWTLMIPDQSLDALLAGKRMERVVYSYSHADDEGKRYIERVSEKEFAYQVDKDAPEGRSRAS
ncbi:helix-turn-helix domain-containing protein [Halorhodospira neutriphila]|uniref:HTH cro/C1-type domain-containing protein n=1 Tax=Halorhodospira neutriphila TaxID=168379 RepID=A0ABS1E3H7_9GAMM|nr:helix-turn-helix transcriptional regulator [Halorhodospira neutriphila]MBK1725697.1 hypothetical protein [Halorhodospira neutriphila]